MSTADRDVDKIDQPRRRYPSDDPRMPEDVSHPHTTEDETSPSLRERLTSKTSKLFLVGIAIAAVAITGYGLFLFGGVIYGVLMNRWVQTGFAIAAAVAVGIIFGARRERSAIAHTDSLVLLMPNGLRSFQGEYVETGDGPAFIPYRGRTGLLRSQKPYTLEQLSAELPRLDSKRNMSDGDEVVIELPKAFSEAAVTDRGVSACVNTEGLKPAHFSSTAALRCEEPSLAHEGRLQEANNMIQELRDELATHQRRLNALMNRLSFLIEDNDRRREDILDEMTELYVTLREADRPEYQRRQTTDGVGSLGDLPDSVFGGDDS